VGRSLGGRLAHHAEAFASLVAQDGDATAVLLVAGRDAANGRIELSGRRYRFHVRWDTPSNHELYAAETAACRELVTALGSRMALAPNWRFLGQPSAAHNLGGCRMADSERDGVVDGEGRVFGYPGLHVLDGSMTFVDEPAHPGLVTGSIHIDGLTNAGGAAIEAGLFHLFLDQGDPYARAMRYTLSFHTADGRRLVLSGVKDVRGCRVIDFWRATTTLDAHLEVEDGEDPVAAGTFRISVPGVAHLLGSMRPVPGGRRRDADLALGRFVGFYARTIVGLYAAGRRAARH
jgi:hypothetical protein